MANEEKEYLSYLIELENQFRAQIRNSYPLFREIVVTWTFVEKLPKNMLVVIDSLSKNKITIQLEKKPKKVDKLIKKMAKFFSIDFDDLKSSYFLYYLYLSFYKMIEAPFSTKDRKQLHFAMYTGIKNANPGYYEHDYITSLEYLHTLIEEFITINRMASENEENKWFNIEIMAIHYYLALEKSLATVNSITVLWYLNTILYCAEKSLTLIENKFMDELFPVASRLVKRTLNKKDPVHLPHRLNQYYNDNKKLKRERNVYKKLLLLQFQGLDRYDGVKRLTEVISPYIDYDFFVDTYRSTLTKDSIYFDLFETFSLQDQALFIRSIFDESKVINQESAGPSEEFSVEFHLMHEFYKKNRPSLSILGNDGFNQNLFQKGNYRVKLNKISLLSRHEVNHLDLERIMEFQNAYGLPVLIPLSDNEYFYYEYEIIFEQKRKVKYRRISRFYRLPDILEIYLDNTGSMYFEEDKDYLGFNDGSRRDNSISVVYAFIMELYQASVKQKKKCYIRLHSFSEKQISTDLIPIEEFVEGKDNVLKVIFKPDNGYNYENLNINTDINTDPNEINLSKVIIVITDGDLVLEGRTEREALKMKHLARQKNIQLVLFEMEQHFSLGQAVKSDPLIVQHSVKNKETMFQKGIEVILNYN